VTTKAEFEQAAIDVFYRTEHSWATAARWLSIAAGILLLSAPETRVPTAVVLLAISVPCQVVAWRAMRGAQRLEDQRLARMNRAHEQVMAESRKGQP
jgi:hypothetical protein